MNIELYINNRLCDIEDPGKFSIYLKRQFINPSELNVKDAQMSYSITLPATPVNNAIFNHANVEEVQGKFKMYDARLYMDGVLILDGKFRLSELTKDSYKGNLGVPAPATIGDIFGNTTMNQAGAWPIDFAGVEDMTKYNTGAYDKVKYGEIPPCIFPFVLYSLLPRNSKNEDKDETSNTVIYPDKDVYDDRVMLGFYNFPPSVNCLQMLEQIFKNAGYTLTGNVMTDERLRNLFVSYQNPNDYEMPWNADIIHLKGSWTNYDGKTVESRGRRNEDDNNNDGTIEVIFNVDMLDADNTNIAVLAGDQTSVTKSNDNTVYVVEIQNSGLYKIEFDATLTMSDGRNGHYNSMDYHVIEPTSGVLEPMKNNLSNRRFEVKVLRNVDDMLKVKLDNSFYRYNQSYEYLEKDSLFPEVGEINFIDPRQDMYMLCGLAWGTNVSNPEYNNPMQAGGKRCNPMAIKGGRSWYEPVVYHAYSAAANTGYYKYNGTGYEKVGNFKVELEGAPASSAAIDNDGMKGTGRVAQVVWLEKGEKLRVTGVSDEGTSIKGGGKRLGWLRHTVDFDLKVTPFQKSRSWLTMDDKGASEQPMNWNDDNTLLTDGMNLMGFLPQGTKVSDWVDNFCKAFNLTLENKGSGSIELNFKNKEQLNNTSYIIDLDRKAGMEQRSNESLKLPYVYEIGFTVDNNEEGYYETMDNERDKDTGNETGAKVLNTGDDGKGLFYTGSYETTKLTHNSNFSYNWFKELKDEEKKELCEVPVITEHEIWDDANSYADMIDNRYLDKAQRFWFRTGETMDVTMYGKPVKAALVSNEYQGNKNLILDYEDKPDSIMRSFFLLLVNNDNNYTVVECYLNAEEYSKLDRALVRFNGDLYNIAEVDGYDPMGRKKTKLKLIRRIL